MSFFEIFKAGKYPQGTFSAEDVEAIAKNYDPSFCEAPITLDHEQGGPAYGWVSGVKAENGLLRSSFKDITPELKDLVNSGKYKTRSVEIYRNLDGKGPYLKAVTFLGAAIPQIKGMEPVHFKDGESDIIQFEMEIENPENVQNFNDEETKNLRFRVQELEAQAAKFSDAEAARIQAEEKLRALNIEIRKGEFEQFLNERIAYGSLTPAQLDICLKILEALDSVPMFSDNTQPVEVFKEFLTNMQKQVNFDEVATNGNTQNKTESESPKNIAQKALEFQQSEAKKGRVIRIDEAVRHVSS